MHGYKTGQIGKICNTYREIFLWLNISCKTKQAFLSHPEICQCIILFQQRAMHKLDEIYKLDFNVLNFLNNDD